MENMFMQSNMGKQVFIVCDKKTESYANFFKQLISQTSDIEATVYSEKQYLDNNLTISSSNYIIFIGSSKVVNNQCKFINDNFSKFGMHYGWLGKQARFYVDSSILWKRDYKQFISFAAKYKNDITASLNSMDTKELIENYLKGWIWGGIIAGAAEIRKRQVEQQYQCLTMVFYQDALSKFLEIEAKS